MSACCCLADRAKPLKLKAEYQRLQHIKRQLSHIKLVTSVSTKAGASTSKLAVSKQDVEVTKSAVLKILMELLKEPDFRDHLLDLGLQAAHARQKADADKVTALEKQEVTLAEQQDKAQQQVAVQGLDRNKYAGDKVAKEEAYVTEHKDFLSQVSSNTKGVYIIETIIDKIEGYCDKSSSEGDEATSAQQAAAVQPLLAAAQAAAEAAWRSGGAR